MAIVRGDDQFLVFKKLLDQAGEKSCVKTSIGKINTKQRTELAEEIQSKSGFIGVSTLRDYRYIYEANKKYMPFSVQSELLSVLADFVGEGSWQAYYKKHGNGAEAPAAWSCYDSLSPIEHIYASKQQLKKIAEEKAQLLKLKE
ncbi:MAG: hypothetical protein AAGA64_12550 [Bacteroidota bacterium]